jgi:hypothetical protein
MNITPIEMLRNCGATFVVGLALGILGYTLTFLSIKVKNLNKKLNFVEIIKDVIIILLFTISAILVLYYHCEGRLRGIFLFVLIIGYWANKILLSRTLYKLLEFLCKISIKTIKIFNSIFIQPIEKLINKLYNNIKKSKYFNRGKLHNERTKKQGKIE